MKNKPKIGLALSGGGARGIAHLGVLQAFEENNISIEMVSGTSAGSIVGALYAAGCSLEEMKSFTKIDGFLKVFKTGFPFNGLVKLDYLKERLQRFLKEDSFEALNKKLFVAVSNLQTGEAEVFSEGPLFDVVVASCSIPLIFKPVKINGQFYVDGGVLMNLPVSPLIGKVDKIIGVNLHPQVETSSRSIQSVFGIAQRVFDLGIQGNSRPLQSNCAVLIAPEKIHQIGIFNFNKWDKIFDIGYEAGLKSIEKIESLNLDK